MLKVYLGSEQLVECRDREEWNSIHLMELRKSIMRSESMIRLQRSQ